MESSEVVLVPGYRLDRYELLAPIASGGMASVWLARLRGKRGFEKLFAIKTIKTELTEDDRFQAMFLDEARIASGIQHPNVAQILDLGEQDDILYIVMEWVDGESLAKIRRIARKNGRPLQLGLALRIIGDACAGLHAAHELHDRQGKSLGVIHRDVSPQNILVSTTGNVKVIDFGVAKARDRHAGDTASGIVKGKIRYMAPEQAKGHPMDRRADIWALGVCLHEIVTGQLPFDGESDIDVVRRLLSEEAPPRPDGMIPEALEEILVHSVCRDPNERFATCAAMQRAIEHALDEIGLPSTSRDVADFLRESVPELETKRKDAVTRALTASEAREAGGPSSGGGASTVGPLGASVSDEAALAPTIAQAREPAPNAAKAEVKTGETKPQEAAEARTAEVKTEAKSAVSRSAVTKSALTKKKAAAAAKRKRAKAAAFDDDSKMETPGPAELVDLGVIPPKRSRGVWYALALAAVLAGAWFVWPGAQRVRAMLLPGAVPEPTSIAADRGAPPRPTGATPSASATAETSPGLAATTTGTAAGSTAATSTTPARDAKSPASGAPSAGALPTSSASHSASSGPAPATTLTNELAPSTTLTNELAPAATLTNELDPKPAPAKTAPSAKPTGDAPPQVPTPPDDPDPY